MSDASLVAPLVKSRKGLYRELFDQAFKQGFSKVLINNELIEIEPGMRLDRYKTHDIGLVIDRIKVSEKNSKRIEDSIALSLHKGKGEITIINQHNEKKTYRKWIMCSTTGITINETESNIFSLN